LIPNQGSTVVSSKVAPSSDMATATITTWKLTTSTRESDEPNTSWTASTIVFSKVSELTTSSSVRVEDSLIFLTSQETIQGESTTVINKGTTSVVSVTSSLHAHVMSSIIKTTLLSSTASTLMVVESKSRSISNTNRTIEYIQTSSNAELMIDQSYPPSTGAITTSLDYMSTPTAHHGDPNAQSNSPLQTSISPSAVDNNITPQSSSMSIISSSFIRERPLEISTSSHGRIAIESEFLKLKQTSQSIFPSKSTVLPDPCITQPTYFSPLAIISVYVKMEFPVPRHICVALLSNHTQVGNVRESIKKELEQTGVNRTSITDMSLKCDLLKVSYVIQHVERNIIANLSTSVRQKGFTISINGTAYTADPSSFETTSQPIREDRTESIGKDIGGGMVSGIVISVVVFLGVLSVAFYFIRRSRGVERKTKSSASDGNYEMKGDY